MTPALEAEVAKLVKEHDELAGKMAEARQAYHDLTEKIAPLQEKRLGVEAIMDLMKPRLRDLETRLPAILKSIEKPPVKEPPAEPPADGSKSA